MRSFGQPLFSDDMTPDGLAVSCPLWPTPTSQLRSQAKQRQAVLGRAVHASAALAATLERPTAGREELNSGSPSQAAEALAPDVTTVNTGMAVTWLGTSSGLLPPSVSRREA